MILQPIWKCVSCSLFHEFCIILFISLQVPRLERVQTVMRNDGSVEMQTDAIDSINNTFLHLQGPKVDFIDLVTGISHRMGHRQPGQWTCVLHKRGCGNCYVYYKRGYYISCVTQSYTVNLFQGSDQLDF